MEKQSFYQNKFEVWAQTVRHKKRLTIYTDWLQPQQKNKK